MNNPFHPLDPDLRQREIVYVSTAKLEQLLLPTERTGFGVSVGGFGGSAETHKREPRELLNQATRFFQDQGLLSYERAPRPDQWLLLRAVMMCGTAWPSFGDVSPADETAWWVGSSESARILAYGNRKHLLGQGAGPHTTSRSDLATWCPSRADAYLHLLKDISVSVKDDQLVVSDPWGEDVADQVRGLEDYFFSNDGVYRNHPLIKRGVYEMMLRVDRVVEDEGSVTVLGSPLWVAPERRSVQGVYRVCSPSTTASQHIVGDWNGREWLSFKTRRDASNRRTYFDTEPVIDYLAPEDLGFTPSEPSVDSIEYLGAPRWSKPQPSSQNMIDPDQPSLWQRFARRFGL